MCLRRAPEKYIAGAALDRAAVESRQCGILNIPQAYRPPRPVMGIALLLTVLVTVNVDKDTKINVNSHWVNSSRGGNTSNM
jgi:hypothetical protein